MLCVREHNWPEMTSLVCRVWPEMGIRDFRAKQPQYELLVRLLNTIVIHNNIVESIFLFDLFNWSQTVTRPRSVLRCLLNEKVYELVLIE